MNQIAFAMSHPAIRKAPMRSIVRIVDWRVRCLAGVSATVRLERTNTRFSMPPRWGGEGTTLIYVARDDYEPSLTHLHRWIHPGDTVIDAGANRGIYSVVAARLVGDQGRVLAFEPASDPYSSLKRNIALNGFDNVSAFKYALSDREGFAQLYQHGSGTVRGSLAVAESSADAPEEVPMRMLDQVLDELGIDHIDFLKIDVEGAEELVFRGASRMLDRSLPKMLMEINPRAAERLGLDPLGAWNSLKSRGYTFYDLDHDGEVQPIDLPELTKTINLLAFPPGVSP